MRKWITLRFREFDLLPDYFRAIASEFQRFLWGPALIAVVFVIASLLGVLPKWVTIIYLVAVMLVAGYYVWRADHVRLMPRFKVDIFHIQRTRCNVGCAAYIQLEPQCLTESPVEQCRGYLIRVLHKWPSESGIDNGEWESTDINEPLPLQWSFSDSSPMTLVSGVPQRLNVFWIYSEQPKFLQPSVENMPGIAYDVLTQLGYFRFEVKLTAKDCQLAAVAGRS